MGVKATVVRTKFWKISQLFFTTSYAVVRIQACSLLKNRRF
jgi:hypothetical protein